MVGPLVETLAQAVVRGPNLQVHYYRDYENPKDRRSKIREVDFIVEETDGTVLPIEIKFRRQIDRADFQGLAVSSTGSKRPAAFSLLATPPNGTPNIVYSRYRCWTFCLRLAHEVVFGGVPNGRELEHVTAYVRAWISLAAGRAA